MDQTPTLSNRNFFRSRYIELAAILGVGLMYLFHLSVVATYAVDLPFLDEWDEFPRQPYLSWFWRLHNEHRIVTTKMVILGLYWLDGWNLYVHQILNFLIYGIVLGVLAYFLGRRQGLPTVGVCLALIWMLSPLPHENHNWGFQTQFHLALLSLLLAVCCLFKPSREQNSWKSQATGSVLLLLCILSFSSGIPASLAVLGVFAARGTCEFRRNKDPKELWQIGAVTFPVLVLIYLYSINFYRPLESPPVSSVFSRSFAEHFLTLITSSIGLDTYPKNAIPAGVALILFHAYPWIVLRRRRSHEGDGADWWHLAALLLGVTAILFAISFGRANFGWVQAHSSRYKEFSCLLVPISACSYYRLFPTHPVAARGGLSLLSAVSLLGWICSLPQFGIYSTQYMGRTADARQVRYVYQHPSDTFTIRSYPKPLPYSRLEEAWRLKLSFTRVPDTY